MAKIQILESPGKSEKLINSETGIIGQHLTSMVNLEELHIYVSSEDYITNYIKPLQNLKILNIADSIGLPKSISDEYIQMNLSHLTMVTKTSK